MLTGEELVLELRSSECQCGAHKVPGQTFCPACYFKLGKESRAALYRQVGKGYEEAYHYAVGVLEAKK